MLDNLGVPVLDENWATPRRSGWLDPCADNRRIVEIAAETSSSEIPTIEKPAGTHPERVSQAASMAAKKVYFSCLP